MVNYRRNRLPGGSYFFTVTLADRSSSLLVDHIALLRQAFHQIRQTQPFTIDAIVVLPEHLHAIWTLPAGDADFSGRWRAIKSQFSQQVIHSGYALKQNHKAAYRLWQARFWEHTLRNNDDMQAHVDYIHYNPVKHRHVNSPVDWPYSSIHRYIRAGLLAPNWAAAPDRGQNICFSE